METIVIALGGNALLSPKGRQSVSKELGIMNTIAKSIAKLANRYKIVITHGNGTQVGDELLKNMNSKIEPLPLYLLNAETQGSIGSSIETVLDSDRPKRGFCTVVTHAIVDRRDGAFRKPSKPIGPFYSRRELLAELRKERFSYVMERGLYRRVVPSPKPIGIVEIGQIRHLLEKYNVICGGGGGIPVFKKGGAYAGASAVIDKDHTTQLIANMVGAKKMVILTGTDYVYRDFSDKSTFVKRISANDLKKMLGMLEEGTIRPKAEACARFVELGGEAAYIGSIGKLEEVLSGRSGTAVER
ncbi:MAG: carbamate kinase [Candidatus Marsarchaeota archaeon]|nr:carbamate kinase [Candidatus Marsarchaeota archaeon]MCL5418606.1 carbamate kinase [Candidatus Marsarchaeota archaeon]